MLLRCHLLGSLVFPFELLYAITYTLTSNICQSKPGFIDTTPSAHEKPELYAPVQVFKTAAQLALWKVLFVKLKYSFISATVNCLHRPSSVIATSPLTALRLTILDSGKDVVGNFSQDV